MALVSHAQNFEDVILWRALHHIDRGFYMDVGAFDPVIDSVSCAFYEMGWRGVHVEPLAECADKLRHARPDEEVIEAAVATRTKDLVFYEVLDTGLSTGSRAIASRHKRQGYEVREVSVPCVRLSDILDRHRDRDIHWLKIDVEGMERQVIQSWTPSRVRPWIVVVESTKPNSPKPDFAAWEPLLIKLGYEFVYFDGLNRFYVSRKHRELKESFGAGPNVFDDFVLGPNHPFFAGLNAEVGTLRQQLEDRRKETAELAQTAENLRTEAASQAGAFANAVTGFESATAGLKAELSAKESNVAARDRRIAELEAELARLAQSEALLRKQLADRTNEAAHISQMVDALRTEAAAQSESVARASASWESASAALNGELLAKNEALRVHNERIAALEAEIIRASQEGLKLREQLTERTGESARLLRTIETLRAQAGSDSRNFASTAAIWGAEISRLNEESAGLRRNVAKMEEANARLEATVAALRAEVATQAENAAQAAAGLERSHAELSAKTEALNERNGEIAALQSNLARVGEEASELRAALAARIEESGRLLKSIEELRAELAASAASFLALSQAAELSRASADEHVKIFAQEGAKWDQEKAELKQRLATITEALANRDHDFAGLDFACAQLGIEAFNARQKLAEQAEELEEASRLAEALRADAAQQAEVHGEATAAWVREVSSLQDELTDINQTAARQRERITARNSETAKLRADLTETKAREEDAQRKAADHREQIDRLHKVIDAQKASGEAAAAQDITMRQELVAAHAKLAGIYGSTSWHITGPLRTVSQRARWLARVLVWPARNPSTVPQPTQLLDATPAAIDPQTESPEPSAEQAAPAAVDAIDLSPEPQSVRTAYRRLMQARAALATPPPSDWVSESSRLRLAYVSPLPPQRSGIADYSAELLPELSRHYQIDVIVDQPEVSDPWIKANCPVRDTTWFDRHAHRYDRIVYHFGNSPFHKHMLDLVNRHPGIIVLHDFYMSGLVEQMDFHGGRPGLLPKALYHSHGYDAMREGCYAKDDAVWKYPANLSVLQSAAGVIVHSEHSRLLAQQFYGDQFADEWAVVPSMRHLPEKDKRAEMRKMLGFGPEDQVVCSFGMMGEAKLNHRLLNAWLRSDLGNSPKCWLVFVGQEPIGEYGAALRRTIEDSPDRDRIRITGFVTSESYREWLSVADMAVQLRALSRGETSASAFDCMSYGLPTIVNAHGAMAELPRDSVLMLPDEFTDAELTTAMETLQSDPVRRVAVGRRARHFVAEQLSPSLVAARYQQAIEGFTSQAAQLLSPKSFAGHVAQLAEAPASDQAWLHHARELAMATPARSAARQLLVDVSAIARIDLKTGIQRVVKGQLLALLNNPPPGFRIEPVWLCDTHRKWQYFYARRYMAKLLALPESLLEDDPVEVAEGDIFFSADFFSAVVQAAPTGLYADWRARGVKTNFAVFDLLPLLLPQYFPVYAEAAHGEWLSAVAENSDRLICISRAVAEDTKRWLKAHKPETLRHLEIAVSHLGADIDAFETSKGLPEGSAQMLDRLSWAPSVLMVGTIEPRKGHLQALAAFEILWREGANVNLVIVGAEGWGPVPEELRRNIPEIVGMLRDHPELDKRLFWLEGISDEYLDKVYAAGACLLAASENEGFGLPLIEAARHKVPILARDIPVFREVAGPHASYFTGNDPQSLADAVKSWLSLYAENRHPKSDEMPWLTWAQSTERLKLILLGKDLFASRPRRQGRTKAAKGVQIVSSES